MALLYMLPGSSGNNMANVRDGRVVFVGQGRVRDSRSGAPENVADSHIRQLSGAIRLSDTAGDTFGVSPSPMPIAAFATSLPVAVFGVVLGGANEQMAGADTSLDITVMTDRKSIRDGVNEPLVRDDVGAAVPLLKPELAIPCLRKDGADPDPARPETGDTLDGLFQDFRPEAGAIGLGNGYTSHVGTSHAGVDHASGRFTRRGGFIVSTV